ncbi:MAG: ABC transporter ATP-binding protein [Thaumarchaeota archaeon]|nr:ABC transporter ATP-binding protein [Nitrososphaerota archaeon]
MLSVRSLTKRYSRNGNPAVENVTFDVNDGEIVGFVGLNGAGKTTTIRIGSGVSLPSSGSISIDGHDIVREKPEASKHIGWVPEFPNFDLNSKAIDLMVYFAGYHGISKDDALNRAQRLLKEVNLAGQEKKKLRTYSQGMKKRFSLAAALLPEPENYLFDEILNGLDPEGIHFIRSLMVDLKKRGKAVLLSSHILTEIENISDRVVFIHKGKIVKIATKQELSQFEAVGGVLKIVIQNLNDDALGYLRTMGEVRTEVSTVWLSNFDVDPTQISTELIKRGFLIREFNLEKSSLEDYFFKLVGVTPNQATSVSASAAR